MTSQMIMGLILKVLLAHGMVCDGVTTNCIVRPNYNQDYFYVYVCSPKAPKWSFGEPRHKLILDNGYVIDYPQSPAHCTVA